jgi:hypothetical protein
MEGGVHAFNEKVMGLIYKQIAASARGIVATSYENSGNIGGSSDTGVDGGEGGIVAEVLDSINSKKQFKRPFY